MSVPTWPLRVAAAAARSSEKTLRRWLDNPVITLHGNDVTTTGTGNQCGWSRNRILLAAITQALVEKNLSPSASAKAGLEFSDSGNAGRAAGEVFPSGKTILAIGGPNGPAVRNVDFDAKIFDELSESGVAILVDLNKVVADVDAVLNS
jgi:hypothetical protein